MSAIAVVAATFDRPMTDPGLARAVVLLILTEVACDLDKSKKVPPATILGSHATLVRATNSYERLTALPEQDRRAIVESRAEILTAWALTVGPPLVGGLAPYGVGPLAASNDVRWLMRRTIAVAVQAFTPTRAMQIDVDDITEEDL